MENMNKTNKEKDESEFPPEYYENTPVLKTSTKPERSRKMKELEGRISAALSQENYKEVKRLSGLYVFTADFYKQQYGDIYPIK